MDMQLAADFALQPFLPLVTSASFSCSTVQRRNTSDEGMSIRCRSGAFIPGVLMRACADGTAKLLRVKGAKVEDAPDCGESLWPRRFQADDPHGAQGHVPPARYRASCALDGAVGAAAAGNPRDEVDAASDGGPSRQLDLEVRAHGKSLRHGMRLLVRSIVYDCRAAPSAAARPMNR